MTSCLKIECRCFRVGFSLLFDVDSGQFHLWNVVFFAIKWSLHNAEVTSGFRSFATSFGWSIWQQFVFWWWNFGRFGGRKWVDGVRNTAVSLHCAMWHRTVPDWFCSAKWWRSGRGMAYFFYWRIIVTCTQYMIEFCLNNENTIFLLDTNDC